MLLPYLFAALVDRLDGVVSKRRAGFCGTVSALESRESLRLDRPSASLLAPAFKSALPSSLLTLIRLCRISFDASIFAACSVSTHSMPEMIFAKLKFLKRIHKKPKKANMKSADNASAV